MRIVDYTPHLASQWDHLVNHSAEGTFLHLRSYMDYHADRFVDNSLMVFDHRDRLIAALPANKQGQTIVSHAGLTYGGWITDPRRVDTNTMVEIWCEAANHLAAQGFTSLIYKPVPYIYRRYPSEGDIYGAFRLGASIHSMGISSAIPLHSPLAFNTNARRAVQKALRAGITLEQNHGLDQMWHILTQLLNQRYATNPVHTLDEISLLMSRFPNNITLHGAINAQRQMIAGVVIYNTHTVAHAQYIAASEQGKELGALPLLFSNIISQAQQQGKPWFDFGISTEQGGLILNQGLQRQKSGMGGRGVAYTSYSIDLTTPIATF